MLFVFTFLSLRIVTLGKDKCSTEALEDLFQSITKTDPNTNPFNELFVEFHIKNEKFGLCDPKNGHIYSRIDKIGDGVDCSFGTIQNPKIHFENYPAFIGDRIELLRCENSKLECPKPSTRHLSFTDTKTNEIEVNCAGKTASFVCVLDGVGLNWVHKITNEELNQFCRTVMGCSDIRAKNYKLENSWSKKIIICEDPLAMYEFQCVNNEWETSEETGSNKMTEILDSQRCLINVKTKTSCQKPQGDNFRLLTDFSTYPEGTSAEIECINRGRREYKLTCVFSNGQPTWVFAGFAEDGKELSKVQICDKDTHCTIPSSESFFAVSLLPGSLVAEGSNVSLNCLHTPHSESFECKRVKGLLEWSEGVDDFGCKIEPLNQLAVKKLSDGKVCNEARGYEGYNCNTCAEGYFKSELTCKPCSKLGSTKMAILFALWSIFYYSAAGVAWEISGSYRIFVLFGVTMMSHILYFISVVASNDEAGVHIDYISFMYFKLNLLATGCFPSLFEKPWTAFLLNIAYILLASLVFIGSSSLCCLLFSGKEKLLSKVYKAAVCFNIWAYSGICSLLIESVLRYKDDKGVTFFVYFMGDFSKWVYYLSLIVLCFYGAGLPTFILVVFVKKVPLFRSKTQEERVEGNVFKFINDRMWPLIPSYFVFTIFLSFKPYIYGSTGIYAVVVIPFLLFINGLIQTFEPVDDIFYNELLSYSTLLEVCVMIVITSLSYTNAPLVSVKDKAIFWLLMIYGAIGFVELLSTFTNSVMRIPKRKLSNIVGISYAGV